MKFYEMDTMLLLQKQIDMLLAFIVSRGLKRDFQEFQNEFKMEILIAELNDDLPSI